MIHTLVSPALGPLQDNGGPTLTHLPAIDSPAIDAGDNSEASGLTSDQRGFARIIDTNVDIGAVKVQDTCFATADGGTNIESSIDAQAFRDALASAGSGGTVDVAGFCGGTATSSESIESVADLSEPVTVQGGYPIDLAQGTPPDFSATPDPATNATVLSAQANADAGNLGRVLYVNNSSGTVALNGLIIRNGNTASINGGGIANVGGTLTVSSSTFSDNLASRGGGIFNYIGTLTVSSSTISGNTATTGGGIHNVGGMLAVSSSTISGNTANDDGGGIHNGGGDVTVTNSTISGNTATKNGGGIYTFGGDVTLANTMVANSTSGGDVVNNSGTSGSITGLGVNIVEDGSLAGAIAKDPALGPLQDNGGLTLTHLPQTGSPAIDTGVNSEVLDSDGNPLTTDQRGFERIVNTTVDIGAVEVGAGNIAYSIALNPTSVAEGNSGDTTNATVTVTRSGATSDASSVDLVLGGTATEGTDYTFGLASGSDGSFNSTTLSFAANETEATFTIAVQGNDGDEPDRTVTVTLSNATAPETATITPPDVVTLTIQDDDGAGVLIDPTSLTVSEGGDTDTYTVVLTSQPTADVTVRITPDGQVNTDATTLTFTPATWDTVQTVTVSAVDDTVVKDAHTGTISHSASGGDSDYNGVAIAEVSVTVQDDDSASNAAPIIYLPLIAQ